MILNQNIVNVLAFKYAIICPWSDELIKDG